jgi:hypothetical protein
MSSINERSAQYQRLASEAAATLDAKLQNIRRDEDAGDISTREAADERITVMTEHLDRLRLLRQEYLS